MNNARTEILSRLRTNQSTAASIKSCAKDVVYSRHLDRSLSAKELTEGFIEKASAAEMSVSLIPDKQDLPNAVRTFLQENQLLPRINISDRSLEQMKWADSLIPRFGSCKENDDIGLIHAFAGIAETGTIVSLSSITLSTASLYLPATCLFLLDADTIETSLEVVMARIKTGERKLPRTINLITGPSRTGDIEQTLQIGAHGPCRVHVFLVYS